MSKTPADQIAWIDCEMTGLNIEEDGLCELAIIITDFDLNPVHEGFTVVINPGEKIVAQMNDFVRDMHQESGLLDEMPQGKPVEEAEQLALEYINRFIPTKSRPLVGGNTIGMDRRFIDKYMPALDERFHYRSIDVSTIKELARRWQPAAFHQSPKKHGGHRALADIIESIRELAYFRETVMVDSPGPDTAAARSVASNAVTRFDELLKGS